jgi:hypothetical protein
VQEKDETRRRWRAEQAAKAGVCAAATPDHPSGRKGTTAGYEAHIAAGENPCTPCRQTPTTPGAACARPTLRYPEGRTGTAAGYQAHKDGGEEACRPCTDAFSAKTITRRRNLPPEELERYRQGNKEASRRRRKEDPEGVRAARHRTLAKNRAAVHEAKSRPCTDCGIQYPYYVMEFDHLDADTKEFNVGAGVTCASYERLLAEIAKCELVCANCHRTRTYLRAQAKKGPRVDGQAAA